MSFVLIFVAIVLHPIPLLGFASPWVVRKSMAVYAESLQNKGDEKSLKLASVATIIGIWGKWVFLIMVAIYHLLYLALIFKSH